MKHPNGQSARRRVPVLAVGVAAAACLSGCLHGATQERTRRARTMRAASCEQACPARFPDRPYQAVYAVRASSGASGVEQVIGILTVDPGAGCVRVVLLSLEGMVLFDGCSGPGGRRVRRSAGWTSNGRFAAGLFEDVEFLHLAPGGVPIASCGGESACRCRARDGSITDVKDGPGGVRVMRLIEPGGRTAALASIELDGNGAPVAGRLRAFGPRPHTLDLKRQSFDFLDPPPPCDH